MGEQQTSNSVMNYNTAYLDTNILNLRLNTQALIDNIEVFLRGTRIEKVVQGDTTVYQTIEIGKPLMNPEGAQAIINYLRLTISPHTVQGNFTDIDYREFVAEMDQNLSSDLMINLDRWEVDENDYDHIIDSIISSVQMFVSRLKDNKERESYSATIKSVESNTLDHKRGISFFGGN